jgi:hypothetical protein
MLAEKLAAVAGPANPFPKRPFGAARAKLYIGARQLQETMQWQ